ncbi:Scramblase any1 [Saccharomyces pastorianus]|uniref:Scramblase any1 n=1 Tax=Saccharomyces pastorianus TaxID=27292 RepID=A0A6C1DY06_SACPS|nr:Scramblase any1 [Saccharomyces pastorianus]
MSTTGPLDATLIRDVAVATATKASYDMSDTLYSYLPKVDQFYIPEWLTMQFIANNLISFTPLFSYGTTIISIEKCKTALGFSIDICATMLIASILRISYYLITPYEITLLRQSLVMIFIQLILLRTSLKYRPDEYKYQNLTDVESLSHLIHDIWFEFFSCINRPKFLSEDWKNLIKSLSFTNLLKFSFKIFLAFFYKILKFFDPNFKRIGAFWQWDDDKNFWRFLAFCNCTNIGLGSIIGSLGLLVESLLPLPQIAILYKLKSVQGFKLILLVSWLCGDTLKITYLIFGAKNISALFVIFALFQMSLDFYIGGQYIYYRYYYPKLRHQHHPNDSNSPSDEDESEMYELDLFNTLQKDVEKALKQDSNDTSDSPQDDQVGKSQAQAVTV